MRLVVILWVERDHNYIIVIIIRIISYFFYTVALGKTKVFVPHSLSQNIKVETFANVWDIWPCRQTVHKVYILYIKTTLASVWRERYFTFTTLITIFLLSLVVNVSRSQLLYNSLVNVDIQKDELISQAVQERLLLAPPPCCHSNKERDGPSHLIFMTFDLMRQQPFSPEEGTAKSKLCPLPPSSHLAFDLYRHQKCHEAMSWQFWLAPQYFNNEK